MSKEVSWSEVLTRVRALTIKQLPKEGGRQLCVWLLPLSLHSLHIMIYCTLGGVVLFRDFNVGVNI